MGILFARKAALLASILCFGVVGEFVPVREASAQSDWQASDGDIEARKIERYQQVAEQSPEKSYAFSQLMALVGKGAAYRKLVETYEKKAAAKPNSYVLAMILGHIYAHGGQTHEALAAYRRALAIKATPLAYMSIAAAESENRNHDEATTAYEAALALQPTKDERQEIWRELAEIALYRRDMARAKTCFAKLIEIEPNSLYLRRELAQIYAKNGMYAEAREALEAGAKLSSASAGERDQMALEIGALYEDEGNDEAALAAYRQASAKVGANHWMQRELAVRMIDIYRRQGRVAEIVAQLEKQWATPTYDQRMELADLYEEIGRADDAEAQLTKAISAAPKQTEAREKIVDFYRSHGKLQEMFEARRDLIRVAPDVFDYRFALYEAYIQNRQIDKAIGVLDEATKRFANDFDALHRVAQAYQNNGYGAKALAIYETWVKKHPTDIEALEILGSLYEGAGQRQKAQATWQKIEHAPVDSNTKLETLARIYDEHDMPDKAQVLYAKYAQANPKDCQVQMQYADVLARNRAYDKAMEIYEATAMSCATTPVQKVCAQRMAKVIEVRSSVRKALAQYRGKLGDATAADAAKYTFFAQLALALQVPAEAIEPLEQYLAVHGSAFAVRSALVEVAMAAGELDKAQAALSATEVKSEADKRDVALALVDVDLAQGKLESARSHLESALQLDANDAETHERLGDVLVEMRLYRDAINAYETARQIDANSDAVAMKQATCLSILAQTEKADAIYIEIASKSRDQALALRAAQRAIDDLSWRGGLDEMAQKFLPLLRSKKNKALYLSILLDLADAQVRPLVLAMQTRESAQRYSIRHEMRGLADKYAQTIVEGLLSDDVSMVSRAMELSEWLSSSSVVQVLGQKIESSSGNVLDDAQKMQAIRAIAHAQLPASVPVLSDCLAPHKKRAIREYALWALGLIASPDAVALLKESLGSSIDSFRALAVIGLGRQGMHLDAIADRLRTDPSPMVKSAAAWILAYHKRKDVKDDAIKVLDDGDIKPYQLWSIVRLDEENAAKRLLTAIWNGSHETRQMALNMIVSRDRDVDLTQMTPSEILGAFIKNDPSHYYMTNVHIDVLLGDFAQQSMSVESGDESRAQRAYAWLSANEKAVEAVAVSIAQSPDKSESDSDDPKLRLLRDFVVQTSPIYLSVEDAPQREFASRLARALAPQLEAWLDSSDSQRSTYAMRLFALTDTDQSVEKIAQIAQGDSAPYRRMQAIESLGLSHNVRARSYIRELSSDSDGLIRAAAVAQLDPRDANEAAILERAQGDSYVMVSRMARRASAKVSAGVESFNEGEARRSRHVF